MQRLIITTGDRDGIGLEVTLKALLKLKSSAFIPIVWIPQTILGSLNRALYKEVLHLWNTFEVESLEDALSFSRTLSKRGNLIFVRSAFNEARWIIESANACLKDSSLRLVTAPLSKTLIKKAGYPYLGHTEIFKDLTGAKKLNMGFIGKDFSVTLVTDHIPLDKVARSLTPKVLDLSFANFALMSKLLNTKKPIGVLGLNPHAGEAGLIGTDEQRIFNDIKKASKKYGLNVVGPLVPDAAFLRKNWKSYAFFACLYHDQGLIPFKMHHGHDHGVHITLGLPFVRTSVDHGTAKDIFNKNKANPQSMIDAIKCALNLTAHPSK